MKPVSVKSGVFFVTERDDYSFVLTRQQANSKREAMHLYGVLISTPFRCEKFFVLAESETGAIDQARCALKMNMCSTPAIEAQITVDVECLPLRIRGWGGCQF